MEAEHDGESRVLGIEREAGTLCAKTPRAGNPSDTSHNIQGEYCVKAVGI